MPCGGCEHAAGDARHADHAATLNGNQCHSGNRRDRLHAVLMCRRFYSDERSREVRRKSVLDTNWNILVYSRHDRLRMQHLCSKVRHFRSFLIRYALEYASAWHDARVRRHYAVNVGPDLNLVCFDATTEDGGGSDYSASIFVSLSQRFRVSSK